MAQHLVADRRRLASSGKLLPIFLLLMSGCIVSPNDGDTVTALEFSPFHASGTLLTLSGEEIPLDIDFLGAIEHHSADGALATFLRFDFTLPEGTTHTSYDTEKREPVAEVTALGNGHTAGFVGRSPYLESLSTLLGEKLSNGPHRIGEETTLSLWGREFQVMWTDGGSVTAAFQMTDRYDATIVSEHRYRFEFNGPPVPEKVELSTDGMPPQTIWHLGEYRPLAMERPETQGGPTSIDDLVFTPWDRHPATEDATTFRLPFEEALVAARELDPTARQWFDAHDSWYLAAATYGPATSLGGFEAGVAWELRFNAPDSTLAATVTDPTQTGPATQRPSVALTVESVVTVQKNPNAGERHDTVTFDSAFRACADRIGGTFMFDYEDRGGSGRFLFGGLPLTTLGTYTCRVSNEMGLTFDAHTGRLVQWTDFRTPLTLTDADRADVGTGP